MLHAISDDGNKNPGDTVSVDGVEEEKIDAERDGRRHEDPGQEEEETTDEGHAGSMRKTRHAAMFSLVAPGDVEADVAVPQADDGGEEGKNRAQNCYPPCEV